MTARPRSGSGELHVARVHAEETAANEAARARAVRVVAGRCTDVDDCRELLAMLGLLVAGAPDDRPVDG